MNNIKKESISILLLLLIIAISAFLFFCFSLGFDHLVSTKSYNWIYYVPVYLTLLFLVNWLSGKYPNKFFKFIDLIMSIPLQLSLLLFRFSLPIIALFYNFLFLVVLSVILPLSLIKLNEYYAYIELMDSTKLFITLTSSSCICILLHKQILNFIYRFGPLRIKTSEKMKKFKLDELTEYVMNKKNIRFLIYTFFFVYLVVFSFQSFQNLSLFEIQEKDKVVYQSFLCFFAFDRLLVNYNMFNLLPSDFLKKIVSSIRSEE